VRRSGRRGGWGNVCGRGGRRRRRFGQGCRWRRRRCWDRRRLRSRRWGRRRRHRRRSSDRHCNDLLDDVTHPRRRWASANESGLAARAGKSEREQENEERRPRTDPPVDGRTGTRAVPLHRPPSESGCTSGPRAMGRQSCDCCHAAPSGGKDAGGTWFGSLINGYGCVNPIFARSTKELGSCNLLRLMLCAAPRRKTPRDPFVELTPPLALSAEGGHCGQEQ